MNNRQLKIIVIGETFSASRTLQRIRAFERLGHKVRIVSTSLSSDSYERVPGLIERIRYRLRIPLDSVHANERLISEIKFSPDVIWFDNARCIRSATLKTIRAALPQVKFIWYCEDDMMNSRHRTRWIEKSMPLFDLWVTTKSFNTRPDELPQYGVRKFLFVNNGYDLELHCPESASNSTKENIGSDITFIGTFEEPRARSMLNLAEKSFSVRIWGNGWQSWYGRHPLLKIEGMPIYNEDYVKCIDESRINLCFLRHFNRDIQTCRSVEIPACGGFMLHERSVEIEALFKPGEEAAYFGDDDDLVEQCRYWLKNEQDRQDVAKAGYRQSREAGLSHDEILSKALNTAVEIAA